MKAIDLIQNNVPPIKIDETIEKALNWMDDFKVNHLPVISGSEFVGLISDDMIYDFNNSKELISKINFIGKQQFVFANAHLFQIMLILSNYSLSVVPVCDNQNNYKGSITGKNLLNIFSNQSSFTQYGATLIMFLNNTDYQFSEIAQIIESNDSKILAFYNDSVEGSNQIKLTIKITQTNLGAVLQTFSRYDYTIDEIFSDEEIANQTQDRYDHLINYLEV
jgi:predicted transcriptional regulator